MFGEPPQPHYFQLQMGLNHLVEEVGHPGKLELLVNQIHLREFSHALPLIPTFFILFVVIS